MLGASRKRARSSLERARINFRPELRQDYGLNLSISSIDVQGVLPFSKKKGASSRERFYPSATLSNCRDTPLLGLVPSVLLETVVGHRRETCGYGKKPSSRGNRQPSPNGSFFLKRPMDAVHRLNGSGSIELWIGLRYSRFPPRGGAARGTHTRTSEGELAGVGTVNTAPCERCRGGGTHVLHHPPFQSSKKRSISPGEETNQDALSNGERTAQSPT